jgi:hypothetical protein
MAIKITIAGVDETARLWEEPTRGQSLTWTLLQQSRGTCTIPLILQPADTYKPTYGDVVEIFDPDTTNRRWVGTVLQNELINIGNDGLHCITVSGVDYVAWMDGQQMTQQPAPTSAASAGTIIATQFGLLAAAPIVLGTIDSGATIQPFAISGSFKSLCDSMALQSEFVWWIDPVPSPPTLNFRAPSSNTAPFGIDNSPGMILWETLDWKETGVDYRTSQVIQSAPGTAPPFVEHFAGDASTTSFNLSQTPDSIVGEVVTGSAAAAVTGTFPSGLNPTAGDTVTIDTYVYKFVSALDNTLFGGVLIGAASQNTCQNLVDAINAKISQSGVTYSTPTYPHPTVIAGQPTGSPARTFKVIARALGTAGNGLAVSASITGGAFTWGATTLTGGADSLPGGTFTILAGPGTTLVRVYPAMPVGTTCAISYYPAGAGTQFRVGGGGAASVMRISTLDIPSTPAAAVQLAAAILTTYNTIPATLQFQSRKPGLGICQYVTIAITWPIGVGAVINGPWIVQEVQAAWTPGIDRLPDPYGHFLYTYYLINSLAVPPLTNFLNNLAAVGTPPAQPALTASPTTAAVSQQPAATLTRLPPFIITDTTVANDVTPHVALSTPVTIASPLTHEVSPTYRVLGVLRKAISADLTIKIHLVADWSPFSEQTWTVTIPAATAVNQVVVAQINGTVTDGSVLYADVLASDGSKDSNGVAAFSFEYIT